MHHIGKVATVICILGVPSGGAWACTCPKWDAEFYANVSATIFVAEVERYDQSHPRAVDWREHRAVKGVPVKLRVLETLKGSPPPNGEMVAVGFEFACEPTFREGDRRILLLSKSQGSFLHLCSERPAESSKVEELKAALRKQ
jgi:hypothetical protein